MKTEGLQENSKIQNMNCPYREIMKNTKKEIACIWKICCKKTKKNARCMMLENAHLQENELKRSHLKLLEYAPPCV